MERIGEDVQRELGRFGPAGGMAAVVDAWPKAVGEVIARNACPARISRDGTLHVAVSSSAWAFELSQLEPEIASRLAHLLGDEEPRRLRFAPGPLPEPRAKSVKEGRKDPPVPTPEQRGLASEIAAQVEDPELRELVAKAAAASLARAADDRPLW